MERTTWPMPRPRDWPAKVNEPIEAAELDRLRLHVQRDRPYGNATWAADAAKRMHLEWTIRDRDRPRAKTGQQTPEA